jgi:peptide/nickel transport system permease protein
MTNTQDTSQQPSKLKFLSYVSRRVFEGVPILLCILILNFLLIHAAPGDPATYLTGQFEATEEFQEQLRKEFGLDRPLYEQLGVYLGKVLRGDLGYSYRYRQGVTELILSRLGNTLILMGTGFIIATVFGVLMGVIASQRAYSLGDHLATFLALGGYSMPVFWLGQLLLISLSLGFGWFPTQGMTSLRLRATGLEAVLDTAHHLVLPATTYAVYHLTLMFRLTRSKMQEILKEDYIITARAKGLEEGSVVYKHALRNALLPVVTVIGITFGFMLAGSVLVETVFAWPGMGRLMYEGILSRDYPVLMGIFTVVSFMVIVVNIMTDIIYGFIDPRVVYK